MVMVAAAISAVGLGGVRSARAQVAGAPVANAGGPYSAYVGQAIQFNAGATIGTNVTFFWNFGDGTTAIGPAPVKAYAAAGAYTATVTASNGFGSTTGTAAVYISPVGTVGGTVVTGSCVFTVAGVVCPGGTAVQSGCVLTAAGVICPGVTTVTPFVTAGSGVYCEVLGPFADRCFGGVGGIVTTGVVSTGFVTTATGVYVPGTFVPRGFVCTFFAGNVCVR